MLDQGHPVGRHLDLDPEAVLQSANDKFLRRFERMELEVSESHRALPDLDAAALDEAWESAKRTESD